MNLPGGWTQMLGTLPQPVPPLVVATWLGKTNLYEGKLDCSPLLKRGEICNGILCAAKANPVMRQVILGFRENIRAYPDKFREGNEMFLGKKGVIRLTGPLAMSEIMYRHLHLNSHLLVDGFSTLGVDFYSLRSYQSLIKENAAGIGSGKKHYSKLKTRIVLDVPDRGWNPVEEPDRKRARFKPSPAPKGTVARQLVQPGTSAASSSASGGQPRAYLN